MNVAHAMAARAKPRKHAARRVAEREYAAIAGAWEDDVLAGRVPAGKLVKKAIARQRGDRAHEPDGYAWDEDEANKACALAEELAYPKGPKRGKPFVLEPWEVWLIRAIFGWVDAITRLPRFHKISIWLPKGNGKSPLAAAIGIIVLARGHKIGAKVYAAAVTEKQANNVFEPAQEMLRHAPQVREAAGLVVVEHAIRGIGDPRTFLRVSAEKRSADGSVGDCYIVDEVHQHPTRALYDVLANNASKVDGSRIIVISTAGTDQSPTAIGWLLYCEAKAVLDGAVDAPAHFALIFEADRKRADGTKTDPFSEETWRQANPNFGVSISARNFKTTAEAARKDPTAQPHFFSTRLGWWVRSASAWMDLNRWDAAAVQVTDEHFDGFAVFLGIDYAPKLDLSAIVQVAAHFDADGKRRYVVRGHGYLPEGSPTLNDIPELRQWTGKWLTLTPGDALDAGYLRPRITEIVACHAAAEVCLDPFGAVELMASLPREGIKPVEIRQDWKHHSPAMTEVQVALSQGRLVHDGSPLMRLCMSNVIALPDRNSNVVPTRANDAKKIDLAVAFLNAMYRAMVADLVVPDRPRVWSLDELGDFA